MPKPQSFNVLRDPGADPGTDDGDLVLVADFAATGRSAASFHDLVKGLRTPVTIWETAPVPWGQEAGMTGSDQVQRWLADVRQHGRLVRALFGFCGGGIYAAALAGAIAQEQGCAPSLLLFDPGFAESRMLTEHVEGFYRRLATSFTDDQLADARRRLAEADAQAQGALDLAARLTVLVHEIVDPAIVRAGWSQAAAKEAAGLIGGYLHWLAGAVDLDPRARWQSATVISSASPDAGLNLIPVAERPSMFGLAHRFDVPHGDLMRTPGVAALTDEFLGAHRPEQVLKRVQTG